jgi:serine/threonine-protein kinase SRPK3
VKQQVKEDKKEPVYQNYNEQPVYPAKYTDSENSEDEGMEDYKVGGYHPVHVGEVYLHRYLIMQKLGWGHFSTVWLAKDLKYNTFVAIKIQKSANHSLEAAYDEVEILQE